MTPKRVDFVLDAIILIFPFLTPPPFIDVLYITNRKRWNGEESNRICSCQLICYVIWCLPYGCSQRSYISWHQYRKDGIPTDRRAGIELMSSFLSLLPWSIVVEHILYIQGHWGSISTVSKYNWRIVDIKVNNKWTQYKAALLLGPYDNEEACDNLWGTILLNWKLQINKQETFSSI